MIKKIMRKIGKLFYFTLFVFIVVSCNQKNEVPSDIQIKKLDYPSASAVEFYDGKLFVLGDDATNIIVLDTSLNILDSVPFVSYGSQRIPKDIKPDFEASTLYLQKDSAQILFFGSLSLSNYRDWCRRYDIKSRAIDSFSLHALHSKIAASGIQEVNIEGACIDYDDLILANRGNKSYPKNHIIIGPKDLWRLDSNEYKISVIEVITNNDSSSFSGISGLFFLEKFDKLIMTVSTEDTRNAYEDGAIGKSYLWIIDNFLVKKDKSAITPDKVIDLEMVDKRFKGSKIESVTITSVSGGLLNLALVADNDDGTSTLFRMSIQND